MASARALSPRDRLKEAVIKAPDTPELRSLRARAAAHAGWSGTSDRTARARRGMEIARAKLEAKLLQEIDPDGTLPEKERAARLKSAVSAHYAQLAYQKAKKQAEAAFAAEKAVGPSVAPDGPTCETTSGALKTEQESR